MKSGIYILKSTQDPIPAQRQKHTGFVLFYHANKPGHGISCWHVRKFSHCTMPFVKDMASRLVLDTDEIRILTVKEDNTP